MATAEASGSTRSYAASTLDQFKLLLPRSWNVVVREKAGNIQMIMMQVRIVEEGGGKCAIREVGYHGSLQCVGVMDDGSYGVVGFISMCFRRFIFIDRTGCRSSQR